MRFLLVVLALALALFALRLPFAPSRAVERVGDVTPIERGDAELLNPDRHAAGPFSAPSDDSVNEPEVDHSRRVAVDVPEAIHYPDGRAMLTVRVTSGSKPIADAEVELDTSAAPTFLGELDSQGVARTDARGKAQFFVRATRMVRVNATLPGSSWSTTGAFTTPFAGQNRNVTLRVLSATDMPGRKSGMLEVVVRSLPSLARLKGVVLRADVRSGRGLPLETRQRTDASGSLEVPWHPGLKYEVTAEGHTVAIVAAPLERGDTPFYIDLPRHASISGCIATVVTADRASTRRPGHVELFSNVTAIQPDIGRVPVDEHGAWAIEGIEIPYGLDELPGVSAEWTVGRSCRVIADGITVRPGDDLELKDRWESAPRLLVRMSYGSGQPLGATVTLDLVGKSQSFLRGRGNVVIAATAALDASGLAAFARVPAGTWPYRLQAPGVDRSTCTGELIHDGGARQTIVVNGFDSISGRVVDASGRGQSGWLVYLIESDTEPVPRALFTDADGAPRFELVRVDAALSVEIGEPPHDPKMFEDDLGIFRMAFPSIATTPAVAGAQSIRFVVEPR